MRRPIILLSVALSLLSAGTAFAQGNPPRNLVLFVPDGLRGRIVEPGDRAGNGRGPRQGRQFQ